MEKHIINCSKVDHSIREAVIMYMVDLELMFGNKPVMNKPLEIDELNKFIQELNEEDDFDPDLLVRGFINN